MQAWLSFENAPPFSAPLRFFLTAPLLAALAGLVLLVEGGDALSSRWHPALLAMTHLLTVGFMLMTMLGALLQVLPVVAGASLAHPLALARVLQPLLALGCLSLAAGFYWHNPDGLVWGAGGLGLAVLIFLGFAFSALRQVLSISPTTSGVRWSLWALAGAVGLGTWLALAMAYGWAGVSIALIDSHALLALLAWGAGLLGAIAYVVVPMFQLTPAYPAYVSRSYVPGLLLLCLLFLVLVVQDELRGALLVRQAALGLALAWVVQTLGLQQQRRRARSDALQRFWQLALYASGFALILLLTVNALPEALPWSGWSLLIGVLLLVGSFVSFITGMLYKILPFLAWMHAQGRGLGTFSMARLLPESEVMGQWYCHLVALVLLLAAVVFPGVLARPAGVVWGLSMTWLALNIWRVVRRYRQLLATAEALDA